MNREQAKEYLKEQLVDYLEKNNINTRGNFLCVNPDHQESTPSMSYDKRRNKVHCFGCMADYDIFNLIEIDYGLENFSEQFKKACELYDITLEDSGKPNKPQKQNVANVSNSVAQSEFKSAIDYMNYAGSNINQTNYFLSRGLTRQTEKNFNLGYDPNEGCVVIPCTPHYYVRRYTNGKKFKNMPNASVELFNAHRLVNSDGKPIFIVESAICAMSIEQVGGLAVALNGLNNIDRLVEFIKEKQIIDVKLVVNLDNDDKGKEGNAKLKQKLLELGLVVVEGNISDECKDPNELLTKDANRLINNISNVYQNINEIIEQEKRALEEEKERRVQEYKKNSVANKLQGFINGIADSVNTPFIPTGFDKLDDVFGGGLFEGLYVVGALSSLGKTTFVMQMMDQIAQRGHDVLIFSLEMAESELISKSVSRLTLLNNPSLAKTNRQITTGRYYSNYSQEEKDLIANCINEYSGYSGNIYIQESVGDVTVATIRDRVRKHIEITGKKPVVVIDYIQILRPIDPRMSDKQAVDYNVMELKRISRDFKIPVFGISSLNRQSYKDKISMSALKESGSLEYSSDVLIGLQLEGAGSPDFDVDQAKAENPRKIEAIIMKNRNGATGGKINYVFYTPYNYFREV